MVRVFSLLNRMRKSSTGNPFFVRLWSVGRMRKKSANLRECVGLRPPPNSPIAFFQASALGSGSSPPPPPSGSAGLEKMLANFWCTEIRDGMYLMKQGPRINDRKFASFFQSGVKPLRKKCAAIAVSPEGLPPRKMRFANFCNPEGLASA